MKYGRTDLRKAQFLILYEAGYDNGLRYGRDDRTGVMVERPKERVKFVRSTPI